MTFRCGESEGGGGGGRSRCARSPSRRRHSGAAERTPRRYRAGGSTTAASAPWTIICPVLIVALAIGGTTTSAFRPELRWASTRRTSRGPIHVPGTGTTAPGADPGACGVGAAPRQRRTFGSALPFAAHPGNGEAFQFGSGSGEIGHRRRQQSAATTTSVGMSTTTREEADATETDEEKGKERDGQPGEEQPLSDVDAEVLLSMLDDDPDLVTERKIRRMLKDNEERKRQQAYRKANGGAARVEEKSGEKQQYASKFFQELASEGESSFWNSLKTKAAAAAESIGILIINKIERDLQLSFALGGFFAERAKRDATRALKAAKKKRKLALAEKSSYDDADGGKGALFLGPAGEDDDGGGGGTSGRGDVYDELNTPMDEIRQVTRNIQEIFATASSSSPSGSSAVAAGAGGGRTLGSLLDGNAPRSERTRRTYARRKRRALARERESLPSKVGRFVTSDLVDGTWQLTSEMKTEEAGYKTKRLREGISKGAEVIGALTGGAVAGAAARLSPGASSSDDSAAATRFLGEGSSPPAAAYSSSVNADVGAAGGIRQSALEDISKWKTNLVANLCFCLEEPDQTWLMADILGTTGLKDGVNKDSLEEVVTKMVQARDVLQGELASEDAEKLDGEASGVVKREPSSEVVKKEMECLRDMVQEITLVASSAVGSELSSLLQNELIWDLEFLTEDCHIVATNHVGGATTVENKDAVKTVENGAAAPSKSAAVAQEEVSNEPFFVDGEEMSSESPVWFERAELEETWESAVPATQPDVVTVTESIEGAGQTEFVTASRTETTPLASRSTLEVLDATAEYTSERINVVDVPQNVVADVIVDAPVPSVMVEVMEDGDIDDDKFKAAESVSEETPKKESFPVTVALRSLDVVFFIAEKIFTVALPGMFSAATTASSRLQKDRRNGLGSDGWEKLENARGASRRY